MLFKRVSIKNILVVVYLIMSVFYPLCWCFFGGDNNILNVIGAGSLLYSYGFGLFAQLEFEANGLWLTLVGWGVFIPSVLIGLILSTVKVFKRKNYKPFLTVVGLDIFILIFWFVYKMFVLKGYFGWLHISLEIVFHLIYFVFMFYCVREKPCKKQ